MHSSDRENNGKEHTHMKKLVSLLLVSIMALTFCASSLAAEEYTLPLGDYDNTFLNVATYDNYYTAASYADPLPVLEEIEKRTGVQINWDCMPSGQYNEPMRVRLAAGKDLPDIVQIPGASNAYKTEIYALALQGTLIPLEELIREHAPNIAKLIWEEQPELGKAFTAPDGHIYHIAQNYLGTNAAGSRSLLLRTDWLDTLNLEVPVTIDDWYNVLKAFKEGDPNGNGLADEIAISAFSKNGLTEYGYLATAFGLAAPGTKYIDDNGTVVCQYDLPDFKDFLAFLNKLYAEGIMDPEYTLGAEAKMNALASKDILGCCSHYAEFALLWSGTARSAGNPNSEKAEYHLVVPPMPQDGSDIRMIDRTMVGHTYGITKNCKDPVLAIKWLDYVYANPEGRDMLLYGLEGLTYTVDENGNKQWTEYVANHPDGLNVASALRSVGAFPAQFSNRTIEFGILYYGQETIDECKVVEKYQISPFPTIMSTEEEIDLITALSADIDTYENEMIQKFVTGQVSLDEFDKFRATVRAMGGDELTAIYQQQLDRYYNAQ